MPSTCPQAPSLLCRTEPPREPTEARAPWAQERPPRGQTTEEAGARSAQQPQRLIPSSPAHPMCPSVPDWKACREREGPHRASPRARLKADAHTHTH